MVKISLYREVKKNEYVEEFKIPEKAKISVGRNAKGIDNDIAIEDLDENKGVSKKHCILYRNGELLSVIDRGSDNGTYVNGKRVPKGKKVELRHGSTLGLGMKYKLEVRVEGQEPIGLAEELEDTATFNPDDFLTSSGSQGLEINEKDFDPDSDSGIVNLGDD